MLKDKATTALAAADLLFERGFPNDAASRYYYAMHLAAVESFNRQGMAPGAFQSGATRWEHATIANNATRLRGQRADRGLYTSVMKLRIQADYREAGVLPHQIEPFRQSIQSFVRELSA